jgi:hypothetical protein
MELQQKIDRNIEILRRDVRSYRGKYHESRRFMINNYFFTSLFLVLSFTVNAQLSQGGFPIEIPTLKSAGVHTRVIRMPAFEMPEDVSVRTGDYGLKSLTFAHTFNVELGLKNAGQWFEAGDYRVWQLQIESEGAKSIGLVFSEYRLPEGARLFLFDPGKELVMGAFTAQNNKAHGRMATFPLAGDNIIMQYEEPVDAAFSGELKLAEINHDYVGIVASQKNRWPRRLSGDCNLDVNCVNVPGMQELQRSVCRVLVSNELGTGTLLNNTAYNGRPYLISAFHVFKSNTDNAEIAVFDFNYESPLCTGIDGYDQQTVSGSQYCAHFDSLDFMLVELSEIPPPSYRPYFAGWDASVIQPNNSYTIHHPNGDTKKISYDADLTDSMTFARRYLPFGHWRVNNWEDGTTEAGSSGSVLINSDKRAAGILTGGNASCSNLSYDAFARFDKMWDYNADSSKQLMCWLDSSGTGLSRIDGFDLYEHDEQICNIITNFLLEDELQTVNDNFNAGSLDEIGERFKQNGEIAISGIAIGIKEYKAQSVLQQFTIRIYEGGELPEIPIKQFKYQLNTISRQAMNYFDFDENVIVKGNFFVTVSVDDELDSLVIYQSGFRYLASAQSMIINDNGLWYNAVDEEDDLKGASLLMQVTVCGAYHLNNIDSLNDNNNLIRMYPNPVQNYVLVEFILQELSYEIVISDMAGNIKFKEIFTGRNYVEIDVSALAPGIYILIAKANNKIDTKRIIKVLH